MSEVVFGHQLQLYDVIEVWWSPNRDRIISLRPYNGPLNHLFREGASIAVFASNKTGMTIEHANVYVLIERHHLPISNGGK